MSAWTSRLLILGALGLLLLPEGLFAQEYRPAQRAEVGVAPEEGTSEEEGSEQEAREALAEAEEVAPPAPAQVGRGGLLVGVGKQEVDYRLSYAHFSRNAIFIEGVAILPVIVVGEISVERIKRDILIGAWAWRLGLRDDLQVELRVPYRYQHDRSAMPEATPPREITVDDRGMGDISAALYYQLPGRPWGQDMIVGLDLKSRTGRDIFETTSVQMVEDLPVVVQEGLPMGTGFWSLKAVVTGVRVKDPAVLFWNLGYTVSLPREGLVVYRTDLESQEVFPETVKVSPGDTLEFGAGIAYALNPELSLNAQIQQALTRSSGIRDEEGESGWVAGSALNVASLRLGAVWTTSPRSTADFSMTFGLTDDAPDYVIELRKTVSN